MSSLEKYMTPIDIVMITWHRPEITERTIRTIKANTLTPHKLIVIDNDSPKPMQKMLKKLAFEDKLIDELIFCEKNYGLESARNIGLMQVTSELFVATDSDCLPPRPRDYRTDWLGDMVELMQKYPNYAAISARLNVMIGTGNIFDGREDDDIVQFGHPGGSLRIMRTEAVREVGGWRDEVEGRGSEETYIGAKLREGGWETAYAVKVKCLHLFGDGESDRWGYEKDWLPSATGHSDIYHPKLIQGDDPEEIKEYTDV
jgi:glycosyltransferase involved in cell wall biosynthesis